MQARIPGNSKSRVRRADIRPLMPPRRVYSKVGAWTMIERYSRFPFVFFFTGSKHTHTQTKKNAPSSIEAERVSVVVGCPTRPPRIPHVAAYLLPLPPVCIAL